MDQTQATVGRVLLAMQRMSWEQGLAAQAFFEAGDPETGVLLVEEALHRADGKGLIGVTDKVWDSVDCGANGLPALYAYRHTGEDRFRAAADKLADWFVHSAPRAADGQLYHNPGRAVTMIDGIYHLVPVLINTGRVDFALEQIRLFHSRHRDPATGLYRQLWDDSTRSWARRDLWTTGNGWMVAALALACRDLPAEAAAERAEVAQLLTDLIAAMHRYVRTDGLLHDVIDDQTTFAEVTAPMMLLYAVYTGIAAGVVPATERAWADDTLAKLATRVDATGFVNDACASPTFDKLGRSAEAQSFFLLATSAQAAAIT